ncbi:hypothetical protein CRENBAI_007644 [Crenichthys baileyi]|uniref:Alpha-macroglobulin-like TED domain-containing protein n=1 Tax=Crenichthys baileyi TaxID=28760 RepID=A0AAV9R197_9TELE
MCQKSAVLPRVMGPLGDGLVSLVQAWPGRVPRGATRPPGALRRVRTPRLAPGWDPGSAVPGDVTCLDLVVLVKAFEQAKPIVRWLSQQQKVGGGYGSTQATIMVYQAVAEYASNVNEPPFDLNVDISIEGRSLIGKISFNSHNHYTTKSSKFNDINKDVKVTATGTGEAMLNMVSLYYARPKEEVNDCEMFDLKLELTEVKIEEEERVYKLKIKVL